VQGGALGLHIRVVEASEVLHKGLIASSWVRMGWNHARGVSGTRLRDFTEVRGEGHRIVREYGLAELSSAVRLLRGEAKAQSNPRER
jgi:hypothetical protein